MLNKMKKIEINVHLSQVQDAVENLIKCIVEQFNINVNDQSDLWEIFEQLTHENFASLKKNVYFADLMKSLTYQYRLTRVRSSKPRNQT